MPKRALNEDNKKGPLEINEKSLDLFGIRENQSKRTEEKNEDSSDSEESYYSELEDEQSSSEEEEDLPDSDEEESEDEEISEEEEESDTGDDDNDSDDNDGNDDDDNDSEVDDDDDELQNSGDDGSDKELKNQINDKEKLNQNDIVVGTKNTPNKSKDLRTKTDENDVDTSDEEDSRNTVGNIPIEWYNEYPHIGYDLEGKKILKPATADELDEFLSKMDDPNYWRTVRDKVTMKEVVLSDEELATIDRIQNLQFPEHGYDPYEPYVDFFTAEKMIHPVSNHPETKASFVPSKWEHKRVMKIVRAIRNGWIKPKKVEDDKPRYYLLWNKDNNEVKRRNVQHIPAPKMKLPGHEESYNPPPEYLPTEEEIAKWENMDPEDRPQNFLPKKYSSLRLVPAYHNFIRERFERCLDLYLCPRRRKTRVQVNPDDLLPKLPKPRDLKPFPTTESIVFKGHKGMVRCIAVDPTGQWLASGSDDKTIKLWEVCTGRCLKTITMEHPVYSIAWNPNSTCILLAAVVNDQAIILNPGLGDRLLCTATDDMIESFTPLQDGKESPVNWGVPETDEYQSGIRLIIKHAKAISQITWHSKGDYFATVVPKGESKSVFIHQLSKRRSQCPFKKAKGLVQRVSFHPNKPFLFVATQRYIRVYNLMKQELATKLVSTVKWISSMAVHPKGDNVIAGSYDKRLSWFDMDLSTKPYKILRSHSKAIRQVAFHRHHPLFASASDDGTVIICHAMVYNDLMQNPLIVPVKILRGHQVVAHLGVLDCMFHPREPWIFSSGADKMIRLYT